MGVRAKIAGAMIVGAMIVGAMIVGAMIVGAMRSPRTIVHLLHLMSVHKVSKGLACLQPCRMLYI